jgi:hypothetical protein
MPSTITMLLMWCVLVGVCKSNPLITRLVSRLPPGVRQLLRIACLKWLRWATVGLADDSLPAILVLLGARATHAAAWRALLCLGLEIEATMLTLGPAIRRGDWHAYIPAADGR